MRLYRYCAGVTDPKTTEPRRPVPDKAVRAGRRRARYLPSAQVVEELAAVPDLSTLAEELRVRLTETSD